MKAWFMALALIGSSPALAGGAIGGSTGSKCAEQHIILNSLQFERLIHEALTRGRLTIHGESMQVEELDLDEQVIQMRSLVDQERSIIWIVEIRDWE